MAQEWPVFGPDFRLPGDVVQINFQSIALDPHIEAILKTFDKVDYMFTFSSIMDSEQLTHFQLTQRRDVRRVIKGCVIIRELNDDKYEEMIYIYPTTSGQSKVLHNTCTRPNNPRFGYDRSVDLIREIKEKRQDKADTKLVDGNLTISL